MNAPAVPPRLPRTRKTLTDHSAQTLAMHCRLGRDNGRKPDELTQSSAYQLRGDCSAGVGVAFHRTATLWGATFPPTAPLQRCLKYWLTGTVTQGWIEVKEEL